MNYMSSNYYNGVTVGFYAETTDSLLDDENELSYGVDDSAHDISIGFTVNQ